MADNQQDDALDSANLRGLEQQRVEIYADSSLSDDEKEERVKEFEDAVRNHPLTKVRAEVDKANEEEAKNLEERREEERQEAAAQEKEARKAAVKNKVTGDNTDQSGVPQSRNLAG